MSDQTFINDLPTAHAVKRMQNPEAASNFVTFMQHGPRKGVSKAISRRLGVEHPRGEGMVRCVNGRFPVADGSEASFAGANRQHPGKSGIGC